MSTFLIKFATSQSSSYPIALTRLSKLRIEHWKLLVTTEVILV